MNKKPTWHHINDMGIYACISKVDKKEGLWLAVSDPTLGESYSFPIAHLLRNYIDDNVDEDRVDGVISGEAALLKLKMHKAFEVATGIA
jgi:hypothetical protein